MSKSDTTVNLQASTFAPLRNVLLASRVMEHLMNRPSNLPGIGVMYGDSGLGKSSAAAYCANKYRAFYVECRSYFTKKSLLLSILEEMGVRPGKTIYEMVNQIGEELVNSRRPLIIDEFDHAVDRSLAELVRDVYEVSNAAILLIGEERFPSKLKRLERFHNRVLEWQPAERSDIEDAQKLAKLYSPDVEIKADLLGKIVDGSRGVTRRICVNIELVRVDAKKAGKKVIDLAAWGNRQIYTGEAPVRRAA
jgi:DNA transposition AAA+ family ATPase